MQAFDPKMFQPQQFIQPLIQPETTYKIWMYSWIGDEWEFIGELTGQRVHWFIAVLRVLGNAYVGRGELAKIRIYDSNNKLIYSFEGG